MTDLNENGRVPGEGDAAVDVATKRMSESTKRPTQVQDVTVEPRFEPALDDAGLELTKLRPRSKAPVLKAWPTAAALTRAQAEDWVKRGGNLGVRLRACDLVVDADPRNYDDGDNPLARLITDFGLPVTWRVETGGGGTHLYLRKPEGARIKAKLDGYGGIDFKTGGGQVVAPGSIHPDTGRAYVLHYDPLDLNGIAEAPARLIEALTKAEPGESSEPGEYTPEQLAEMLSGLDAVDFADQDKWLELMMACHHATGGNGIEEFVSWSTGDPVYADREAIIRTRWRSLGGKDGPVVTQATLFRHLHDVDADHLIPHPNAADEFPDDGKELVQYLPIVTGEVVSSPSLMLSGKNSTARDTLKNAVRAVEMIELRPATDELANRVVFRGKLPWPERFGRTMDDDTLRQIRLFLTDKYRAVGYEPSKDNVFEAVTTLAYQSRLNLVLEYLDGLTWDGQERVQTLFPRYFTTPDDAFTRAASACFMVGAVRRQRQPGCKFDTIPVLKSREQGKSKGTGIQALFGSDWYADAQFGDFRSKDSAMVLDGSWGVEMAELDGLRRSDVNAFKAFASRGTDKYRAPYDRTVREVPRRCVIVGTANDGGYIHDMTGARRLWPMEVEGEVDVAAIQSDRDQLWAEAAHMEAQGASLVLPRELWDAARERQADETTVDPWLDDVREYIETLAHADLPTDRVHTADLFRAVGVSGAAKNAAAGARMRTVMEAGMKWRHRRGVRIEDRVAAGYVVET